MQEKLGGRYDTKKDKGYNRVNGKLGEPREYLDTGPEDIKEGYHCLIFRNRPIVVVNPGNIIGDKVNG